MRFIWLTVGSLVAGTTVSHAQDIHEHRMSRGLVKVVDDFSDRSPTPSGAVPLGGAKTTLPAPLEETFRLHSNPTATKVIYLDFDGHWIIWRGDDWYYVPFNIEGSDETFSETELMVIQLTWQSVAEDFLPFDLNVTTEDPGVDALMNTGGKDTEWGIRAMISHNDGTGGWAYMDSFTDSADTELYAYGGPFGSTYQTAIWIADTVSHEAGHSLGLDHDGTLSGVEYYEGHGTGDIAWSPIMGWTNWDLSQWSIGEYTDANNQQDDLSIITTRNGFGFRADDHGSTTGTATPVDLDTSVVAQGIIEQRDDVDYFAFTVSSDGKRRLTVNPDGLAPNLDIEATLLDDSGAVLAVSNPPTELHAELDLALAAGDYFLAIDGVGYDDPKSDGYSDYGSLGAYTIQTHIDGKPDTGDTGDTAVPADPADTDDTAPPYEPDGEDTPGDSEDSGGATEPVREDADNEGASCGCATGHPVWPAAVWLLPLLVARRRER